MLLADFPEAIHPFRCLDDYSRRQGQQHIAGFLKHVHWGQDELVFPTVEGGNVLTCSGGLRAPRSPCATRYGLGVSRSVGSLPLRLTWPRTGHRAADRGSTVVGRSDRARAPYSTSAV